MICKYYSGDQFEKNETGAHVTRMGERRRVYRVLVETPDGKISLGRPGRKWQDNIKMDLQEEGYEAWTGFIRLRTGTGGEH
jgi:hypothetical protein